MHHFSYFCVFQFLNDLEASSPVICIRERTGGTAYLLPSLRAVAALCLVQQHQVHETGEPRTLTTEDHL